MFCRIHQCISIEMLAERLNMQQVGEDFQFFEPQIEVLFYCIASSETGAESERGKINRGMGTGEMKGRMELALDQIFSPVIPRPIRTGTVAKGGEEDEEIKN